MQALADELASLEASLNEEQKTLLGRKVVAELKEEVRVASKEQTAILFRAQLANKNVTVSRFRCAASLDLTQQAVIAAQAAVAPEQLLQRAFAGLLSAAKRASMESIYAELRKMGATSLHYCFLEKAALPSCSHLRLSK